MILATESFLQKNVPLHRRGEESKNPLNILNRIRVRTLDPQGSVFSLVIHLNASESKLLEKARILLCLKQPGFKPSAKKDLQLPGLVYLHVPTNA